MKYIINDVIPATYVIPAKAGTTYVTRILPLIILMAMGGYSYASPVSQEILPEETITSPQQTVTKMSRWAKPAAAMRAGGRVLGLYVITDLGVLGGEGAISWLGEGAIKVLLTLLERNLPESTRTWIGKAMEKANLPEQLALKELEDSWLKWPAEVMTIMTYWNTPLTRKSLHDPHYKREATPMAWFTKLYLWLAASALYISFQGPKFVEDIRILRGEKLPPQH